MVHVWNQVPELIATGIRLPVLEGLEHASPGRARCSEALPRVHSVNRGTNAWPCIQPQVLVRSGCSLDLTDPGPSTLSYTTYRYRVEYHGPVWIGYWYPGHYV